MKGGVRKRGKKWYYYFDVGVIDGKRKKIERVGGLTKKEAQDALRNALNEFENCGSVVEESNISFSDFLNLWYEQYVEINCKYNTKRAYKNIIEKHLKPSLGIYKLKNITPARLQEYINFKFKEGYSMETLRDHRAVLSNCLKYAVYPGELIKDSPVKFLKIPKDNSRKDNSSKIITLEEYNQIIKEFPFGDRRHIPLEIGFHTGFRISEILGLTWDDIDLENKTITVNKILILKNANDWILQSPKTQGSYRTLFIGDSLVNTLKKHKVWQNENKLKYGEYYTRYEHDFVCTYDDGRILTHNSLKNIGNISNMKLGIRFSFHKLRHLHATILIEAGANMKDVQERLGHTKISTTMDVYSHVTSKLKYQTVDIFEKAIK